MKAPDRRHLERNAERLRGEGLVVEFGNPGYPRELWLCGGSNDDHRWHVWSAWKLYWDETGLYHIGDHWWYGRWERRS
jgi:hypothetical protein